MPAQDDDAALYWHRLALFHEAVLQLSIAFLPLSGGTTTVTVPWSKPVEL